VKLFNAPAEFCTRWFRLPATGPQQHSTALANPAKAPPTFDTAAYDRAVDTSMLHYAALLIRQVGVGVPAKSFRLFSSDLATIREQESISRRYLQGVLDGYRQSTESLAEQIETTTARLLAGDLAFPAPEGSETSIPDLERAWRSYVELSRHQDTVMEIRGQIFALGMVRASQGSLSESRCGDLFDELWGEAFTRMDEIIAKCATTPVCVIFDPAVAATASAQLIVRGRSKDERIETFVSRFDILSARALSYLAWSTLAARDRIATAACKTMSGPLTPFP
jgi:hypothetical protein